MKQYNDAFQLHNDIEKGVIDVNFVGDGIWSATDTDTQERKFIFVDETEMFYPAFFDSVKEALKGRSHYCKTMLG